MKRLTLIRHAHAMGKEPKTSDFDRPLSRRGHAEAQALGKHLRAQKRLPGSLVTSPAQRAKQTADILAIQLALPAHVIKYVDSLYLARSTDILRTVQSTAPGIQHLAIVGHNPGLSELTRLLAADATLTELGTAVASAMNFDVTVWSDIAAGKALDIERLRAGELLELNP